MLPSQCQQCLVLDLIQGLGLSPAVVAEFLTVVLDLSNNAIQVQGEAVVHGQHEGHVCDLVPQVPDPLSIELP